jgi:hypothetical protein
MEPNEHASRAPGGLNAIHERWITRLNRSTDDPEYREEWYGTQCGGCRHWFPIAGRLGTDYGVCANMKSQFDGTARFEHDGCDGFENAGAWVIPSDL